ncbi:MAG: ATP-binding cassette domain-containing protein [Actinobacteria bacterium]|uniref:Unannotated protein n=1 Tax=freshwater metagenome TaxID=449393 RepID=A0A6J7L9N1_9ZZZZ|nr:ATP-binding cassette domain-containing protein [Actinomycetota bacterium]
MIDSQTRPADDVALRVQGVAKSFGATRALKGVTFEAKRGEVHCLLGGNGSGKSTLIKILAGIQSADEGQFQIGTNLIDATSVSPTQSSDLGVRVVHQQNSTFADLSVAENLCLGHGYLTGVGGKISWKETRRRAIELLDRFAIDADPDTQLSELSPANQTMVAIARALQDQEGAHEGVLVLDEPTAALPAHEVNVLLDALRGYAANGQTIIFVTHRLDEVLAVADTITVLRDGNHVATLPRTAVDHAGLVDLIMGRSVKSLAAGESRLPVGQLVLSTSNLSGGPVKDISLTIHAGEIVGIAGLLGSGRSSILKMIFGLLQPESGTIEVKGTPVLAHSPRDAMRKGVAYVPEDRVRDSSFNSLSVLDNLGMSTVAQYFRRGAIRHREEASDGRSIVDSYMIKTQDLDSLMSSLSGGNQQKVVMARWLRRKPQVLLLDEPTQGVDVGARFEIWDLVRRATAEGTAVLVVSSDYEELAGVSDRVLVLQSGRLVAEVAGNDLTDTNLERLTMESE